MDTGNRVFDSRWRAFGISRVVVESVLGIGWLGRQPVVYWNISGPEYTSQYPFVTILRCATDGSGHVEYKRVRRLPTVCLPAASKAFRNGPICWYYCMCHTPQGETCSGSCMNFSIHHIQNHCHKRPHHPLFH